VDAYTQEDRLLRIDTVLGQDHVLLVSLRGTDRISTCFSYDLELASTDAAIKPDDLLGTGATITLNDARFSMPINGIVSRFAVVRRIDEGLTVYRIRLVPTFWLLTRTSDCRIFQDMKVSQIVDQLLGEQGISKKSWRLTGDHPVRNYCVQYRETAHDFICRLLEEEGIFFYFVHDDGDHTIVFSDNNQGFTASANKRVATSPQVGALGGVWEWQDTYQFRSGQWTLDDYNFETPSTDLVAKKPSVNAVLAKRKLERFDYPGRYASLGPGQSTAKLRIEYEEAAYEAIVGEGACLGFATGAYFKLTNAYGDDTDDDYVLTSVQHVAEDWGLVTRDSREPSYTNQFTCALRKVPYRPPMKTHPPRIHGTQTAVVTGPAGSEIFTDKYGRIKVQFHWDRQGKKDEHTSCWIRVAQSWAGRSYGTWYLPRIGQEVVVAFEEGDPDRPLVVGSVYNAEQTVPFALPANKTQSGLRTHSSMGGSPANCNEFRFEDKKGSEQVLLHAEKDLTTEVEHDASHWVGHDETTTVDHDRTEHVKHDETITIDNNRTETVHANETITVDKNRTEMVHMNETVTIDKNRTHTVMMNEALTVGIARAHTVGAAETINVGAARTVTVGDTQAISVGSDQSISVGGDQSISVGADETVSVGKNRATSIGEDEALSVAKKITITAGEEIVLKTGSATLTMKKNGDIVIEGKMITVKGSGDVNIKGQKIHQN
jgi:type VI secretion system secreted protein VgrG